MGNDVTPAGVAAAVTKAKRFEGELGAFRLTSVMGEDLGFGMARMYELRRGQEGTNRVFRNVEDALAWLGFPQRS